MKFRETTLKELNFNPLKDMIPDSLFTTAGQQLKIDLGLKKFRHVMIQKVMSISQPVYVVTYNSRYPNVQLPAARVKKLKFTWVAKTKRSGLHTRIKPVKLTPPLRIETAMVRMSSNSIVIFRDMAGEFLRNRKMFTVADNKIDKQIDLI
jgi:hypothetical protein